MKDIYILGDSLALPRPEDKGESAQTYRDTYVAILADALESKGCHVIHNGNRGRRVDQVRSLLKEVIWSGAKTVIIQVGIVDCAPRVFSKWQNWILRRLPKFLRNPILLVAKKYKLRILRLRPNVVYTKKSKFDFNLKLIVEKMLENNIKVIFCSIAPAGELMIKRNPNIIKNVREYNSLIESYLVKDKVSIVYMDELFGDQVDKHLMKDGHHLSNLGHRALASSLLEQINE